MRKVPTQEKEENRVFLLNKNAAHRTRKIRKSSINHLSLSCKHYKEVYKDIKIPSQAIPEPFLISFCYRKGYFSNENKDFHRIYQLEGFVGVKLIIS